MDVVVTGRHCEISESFRGHAAEKLTKLEKHDHRIIRVHVEVDCESNPRQHDKSVHVELTAFSKGPVIRAEAAADHQMAALDLAVDKMAAQMRRAADRRRVHHGRRTPVSVGQALAETGPVDSLTSAPEETETQRSVGPIEVTGDGPLVLTVREARREQARGERSAESRGRLQLTAGKGVDKVDFIQCVEDSSVIAGRLGMGTLTDPCTGCT